METGLTKQKIISELIRSAHGDLKQYVPVATEAVAQDPEFMAHLIAYNEIRGQIRDSKVALPVASLVPGFEFAENSLAHLALLDPRNLVRAIRFAKELTGRPMRSIRRMTERYLRVREESPVWWERTAVSHRASIKTLYAMFHVKPLGFADSMLFKGQYPSGSLLGAVASLKDLPATAAAATILEKRIPFLVAVSALGSRAKDTDMVLAIIERMSPTELVTNTKMLEKLGIKEVPALRAAFEVGLAKVATSKKATFKTTRAAESVTDEVVKAKLVQAQEKQIKALGGIDGNWLVLADKSASMQDAIEISKLVSATLAKAVTGKVLLVFFDSSPYAIEVTGKDYTEIKELTKHVRAGGSTSIGVGLQYAMEKNFEPDGIAIVSDGAENTNPQFVGRYERICKDLDREIPVYLYWTRCLSPNPFNNNPDQLAINMRANGHDLQVYDLRQGADFYSLPDLIGTMRVGRYSLLDDVMATPLLTLDEVFKKEMKNVA